jgi:hypothetical protein
MFGKAHIQNWCLVQEHNNNEEFQVAKEILKNIYSKYESKETSHSVSMTDP